MGAGYFPGVKRSERGVDHSLPFSAEVKERVGLYSYSPVWAFVACSRVNFTFYLRRTEETTFLQHLMKQKIYLAAVYTTVNRYTFVASLL
jgi:hypothetical protein